MKQRCKPLPQEFAFAGFSFPKYVWTLPPASLAKRKERYSPAYCCGDYYHAPKPGRADRGTGFYLDSDGMPGLRWQWCDEVNGADIGHRGWFTDEHGDKIRGVVFRLPKGRGFLIGWSMGKGMASSMSAEIWPDELTAARAADGAAEEAAEEQREHEESERARLDAEEMAEIETALCVD